MNRQVTPVVAGLATGIAFIVLFSTIGIDALSHYPRYDLGTKDELVSKLFEYFREPNGVKITGEAYYNASLAGGQDIYAYGLVADHDSKNHGTMRIFTYPDEMRVHGISIEWRTRGEPELLNAADLIVSGIADVTIPDWQRDDAQPNRNVKMLDWIDANIRCTKDAVVKDDFSEQRKLYLSTCDENISLLMVRIEP